jgi:hypothetical protein
MINFPQKAITQNLERTETEATTSMLFSVHNNSGVRISNDSRFAAIDWSSFSYPKGPYL